MDAFDDPDQYEDVTVPVGCDLVWAFSLEPWDGTGTTAVFNVGALSQPMTITPTSSGGDVTTAYSVRLTPAALAGQGLNVSGASLPYNVRWTDTSGQVWALGYGVVLAT